MQQSVTEIRYFLFSQQLADGLRTTAAIVLPAVVLNNAGLLSTGMTISLGALAASVTDAPGPIINRRNGMLIAAFVACLTACITAFARVNVYLLGIEIGLATFFFSLLQVYGMRAASVGTAAILILVLTMGRTDVASPLLYALYILAGGLWYLAISLFFYYIRPYRPAQRVLGDCIREVADYLAVKGFFYDVKTDLPVNYKKLVAQQVMVSEKQDAVREFFFKTARIADESTTTGRRIVATFVATVDLFEDITAIYYNYSTLRNRFEKSGVLAQISIFIRQLAEELDVIGIAVQSNRKPMLRFDVDAAIGEVKRQIDAVKETEPDENTLVLKKILVNMRRIAQRIRDINTYFDRDKTFSKSHADHGPFISHQPLHPKLLWHNLNIHSAAFRYALRLAIACLAGFAISKILNYGHHSYWILLTIAFILKPAFSLTKTRNIERIWGTVAGGVAGVIFLLLVKNATAQFTVMVLLMIGAFSFNRSRYVVMVICTTAYILILFQFLDIPFLSVARERIFDTVLGCAIAFAAGYFLFPDWEAAQLQKHMAAVLVANAAYLQKIIAGLQGKGAERLAYKLARKAVYVQSANLSAAYQRMAAEPKSRQRSLTATYQFLVRNHLLFSNMAHVAALVQERPLQPAPALAATANIAVDKLYGLSKKLDADVALPEAGATNSTPAPHAAAIAPDDVLLQKALEFIVKLCGDIEKTTGAILAA